MEDAEIIGRHGEFWVTQAASGRRYFLRDEQIVSDSQPHIGQRGMVGYVQGAAARVLTFLERKD